MTDLSRDLAVYADDEPITGFRHARLIGKDAIGLYPVPFTLQVWNLPSSDYFLLCAARELSVRHHDSVLASGRIADICKHPVPEGMVTEIVFAAGLELWETPVNLSVEAGTSVSDTVRRILDDADTGIRLLSFPGSDPVIGWPLGKKVSVSWKGQTAEGLVAERTVDADNMEGKWQCELLVEVSV